MFTLLYNPYLVNWFTRGEEGVKTGQNLVHVVCERPLTERTLFLRGKCDIYSTSLLICISLSSPLLPMGSKRSPTLSRLDVPHPPLANQRISTSKFLPYFLLLIVIIIKQLPTKNRRWITTIALFTQKSSNSLPVAMIILKRGWFGLTCPLWKFPKNPSSKLSKKW